MEPEPVPCTALCWELCRAGRLSAWCPCWTVPCAVLPALTIIVLECLEKLLQSAGHQPDALRLITHGTGCHASLCPLSLRLQHTAQISNHRSPLPHLQQDLAPCSKLKSGAPSQLVIAPPSEFGIAGPSGREHLMLETQQQSQDAHTSAAAQELHWPQVLHTGPCRATGVPAHLRTLPQAVPCTVSSCALCRAMRDCATASPPLRTA